MTEKSSGDKAFLSTADVVASESLVREELERILSSETLAQSESLKRFLRHVVEATLDGRESELKELTLGSDVFGRGESYDPRLDPIVRVQATRLRGKLREFYHGHESGSGVRIELPRGSYVPEFRSSESVVDGDVRAEGPSLGLVPKWIALALAATALVVIVTRLVSNSGRGDSAGADVRSLIVLPFTDMSPAQDKQYYGDGLADEITTTLAEADGLEVVPRTTAFAYRGRELSTVEAELHVDAALQGSVRISGETLRITAQLIRAADGQQIWAESFDRADEDVFRVQETIARSVARAVEKKLTVGGEVSPSHVPEPAAYEDYLKGRFELSRTSQASVERSIYFFERAIETDPDYAKAYAGLVHAYVVNVLWGLAPPGETRELAREAAEAALRLDGDHPEARAAAAAFRLIYEWDLGGARELLASTAAPNDEVHVIRGLLMIAESNLDAASTELETAARLSPDAPFVRYLGATVSLYSERYEEALEICRSVRAWAPNYPLTPLLEARVKMHQGELGDAAASLDEFDRMAGETALARTFRAVLHARAGREREAREMLEELRTRTGYVPPALLARVLVALGDTDAALDELDKAQQDRSLPFLVLGSDPEFAPVRNDARFVALLHQIGLSR